MRISLTAGAVLALALLVGCDEGRGETKGGLKSGPQVGDGVGIFEPLNVTGPFEGERRCLV